MWAHRVRECCHFLTCSVVTDPRCLLLQMDNHQHHVPALLYALFILFNKDLTRTGLSDYGLKIQDIVPRGIYRSALQPYAAMWGIFWYVSHFFLSPCRLWMWLPTRAVFYILVCGISVFYHFSASSFISSCEYTCRVGMYCKDWSVCGWIVVDINLPVFFILYVGYKLWHKTKMVRVPLQSNIVAYLYHASDCSNRLLSSISFRWVLLRNGCVQAS